MARRSSCCQMRYMWIYIEATHHSTNNGGYGDCTLVEAAGHAHLRMLFKRARPKPTGGQCGRGCSAPGG